MFNCIIDFVVLWFLIYVLKFLVLDVKYQLGDIKRVILVSIGGKKVIKGGNGLVFGLVDYFCLLMIMESILVKNFLYVYEFNVLYVNFFFIVF